MPTDQRAWADHAGLRGRRQVHHPGDRDRRTADDPRGSIRLRAQRQRRHLRHHRAAGEHGRHPDSTPTTTVGANVPTIETREGHGREKRSRLLAPARSRLLAGASWCPPAGLLRQVRISPEASIPGTLLRLRWCHGALRAIKCKRAASFFSVGTEARSVICCRRGSRPGSYTYDIEAVNGTGQATKLVSGISHVVFQVR